MKTGSLVFTSGYRISADEMFFYTPGIAHAERIACVKLTDIQAVMGSD